MGPGRCEQGLVDNFLEGVRMPLKMFLPSYLRTWVASSNVSALNMLADKLNLTPEDTQSYIVSLLEMQG